MKFINTRTDLNFPFSGAVVYSGRILETVLVGIPRGEKIPVVGGANSEMREIFRQLDEILSQLEVDKTSIVSVRLYLDDLKGDIGAVNQVYSEYFGSHAPNRRAYGVDLQSGMHVEAAFVAELPIGND